MFSNMQAMPGETYNKQITPEWNSAPRAILYLFSPRLIPDQVRRPHVYNFNLDFMNVLNQSVINAVNSNRNIYQSSYMNEYPESYAAIMPAHQGIPINTKAFCDLWTFVLVIDNDSPRSRGGIQLKLNNRLIYTGFCFDEPVNPQRIFGRVTPNPNCIMQVTHQTSLTVKDEYDSYGHKRMVTPIKDDDIISPDLVAATGNDAQFLLRPSDLMKTRHTTGDGSQINVANMAYIKNYENNIEMDSIIKSPKKHLQTVVKAITDTAVASTYGDFSSPSVRDTPSLMVDMEGSRELVRQNLCVSPVDQMLGINVSRPFSLSELQANYGCEIVLIEIPYGIDTEIIPQDAPTPTNIFSSILSSTIPSLMANYGISDLHFSYVSELPNGFIRTERKSDFEIQVLNTFIPEDPGITKGRWNNLLNKLEIEVFPIIKNCVGNFQLNVACQCAGACYIQLQLLDHGIVNNGCNVTNGFVNAIATPLIGQSEHLDNNSALLDEAISCVLDAPKF